MPDDEEIYAPSVFMSDYDLPDPATQVNASLPRAAEGGINETIKRAVVTALREGFTGVGMTVINATTDAVKPGNDVVYIDLEYPMKAIHYPGIWVQFSTTSLKRAGIDQEAWVKDDNDQWCPVQEWEVQGRVNLNVVGLKNKDRDRIADTIIAMLAFSRPPNVVITKPEDINQHRALKTALSQNPHVAMTLNTDLIFPGGQSANIGVPWQAPGQSDTLAYEDLYAFDLLGQFNVMFKHDGTYTLSRIDIADERVDDVPNRHVTSPWYGVDARRTL